MKLAVCDAIHKPLNCPTGMEKLLRALSLKLSFYSLKK